MIITVSIRKRAETMADFNKMVPDFCERITNLLLKTKWQRCNVIDQFTEIDERDNVREKISFELA